MYVFKLRLLVLPFAFWFRTSLAAELASQPVLPDDGVDGPAANAEQLGYVQLPATVQDSVRAAWRSQVSVDSRPVYK